MPHTSADVDALLAEQKERRRQEARQKARELAISMGLRPAEAVPVPSSPVEGPLQGPYAYWEPEGLSPVAEPPQGPPIHVATLNGIPVHATSEALPGVACPLATLTFNEFKVRVRHLATKTVWMSQELLVSGELEAVGSPFVKLANDREEG